jgi:hypothetical protein
MSGIICASRPLTTLELRHALTIEAGDSELSQDNLQEIYEMVCVRWLRLSIVGVIDFLQLCRVFQSLRVMPSTNVLHPLS